MGIDYRLLPPWAQQQIAQKLRQQNAAVKPQDAAGAKIGSGKYHNSPDERKSETGAQVKFDSRKEAARYDDLMLLLKAGAITDLRLQPEFTLVEAYTKPTGERVRSMKYKADFSYWKDGAFVVEDVKSPATKTKVYMMKRKLMYDKFGITITEVE